MIGKNASYLICLAALATATLLAATAAAQDPNPLKDRLHASDTASSLGSPDLKPWYLKMEIQLFDDKGQPTDSGTIEEWWKAPGAYRRVYTTKLYTSTEIYNNYKFFRTKGAGSPPYYLDLLRDQVVHPMPKATEIDESKPELRKEHSGKIPLDCIMLTQPVQGKTTPLGLFPTYCFDPGKDTLRISFDFGGESVLRNKLGTFQGKSVTTDISVKSGAVQLAAAQVVTLRGELIADDDLKPGDDLALQPTGAIRVSSGTIAGMLLSRPNPVYPEAAKQNHIQGTIVLHAVVGTDGRVHSLRLAPTPVPPDPDLAMAAINAVRRWTYKPYILNGAPVDVDTAVSVNFTLNWH